jgi:hypothetical protein
VEEGRNARGEWREYSGRKGRADVPHGERKLIRLCEYHSRYIGESVTLSLSFELQNLGWRPMGQGVREDHRGETSPTLVEVYTSN